MDSKLKLMMNLARKLQEELEISSGVEDQLQRRLDKMEEESFRLVGTLNGIVMGSVEGQKKVFSQDFDEDFMYVTEKID
jgi:hypothetical protein